MKLHGWILMAGMIVFSAALDSRGEASGTEADKVSADQARSHAIETIEYDAETRALTLTFKRGAYRYEDVPVEVYEGLNSSDSRGTYFKENIRGKFKTTKVKQD